MIVIEIVTTIAYQVLSILIGIGLLFYLVNKALKNAKYKQRGLVNIILGLLLVLSFLLALVLDYKGGNLIVHYYPYLLFITISFGYSFGFSYKHLRYDRGTSRLSRKTINKYYFKDYIYLVYRYENNLYIKKDKDLYKGLVYKIKENDFHDSFIININSKFSINSQLEINKAGKITVLSKKSIFNCYVVNLYDDLDIKGLDKVNAYQLLNYNLEEFDKTILYRIVLKEEFDIEIK